MLSCRNAALACCLFAAGCATGNNRQLTELQAELRAERELLKEVRVEMQALIKQLEPMVVFAEFLGHNRGLLDLSGEGPDSVAAPAPTSDASDIGDGNATPGDKVTRISRSVVDGILADPTLLAGGGRIVPSIRDGQPNGFKFYAIRPNSIYAEVGLMNGDTVHSINGLPLTTPDATLDAYTKLRGATKIVIAATRRGQPVTLTVHID